MYATPRVGVHMSLVTFVHVLLVSFDPTTSRGAFVLSVVSERGGGCARGGGGSVLFNATRFFAQLKA